MHTYIICEIGSNHNGDIQQAKKMIQTAKQCGADAVKFQIFTADTLYSYYTPDFDKYHNVYAMIKGLEVPWFFFEECYKFCNSIGIEFLATPFDDDAVDFIVRLGVNKIKIASFEFSDIRFISYVAQTGLPIIASTGLSSVDDIKMFMRLNEENDVTLLHCNSAYPTPDQDANLNFISYLKQFCSKVGYSDHTQGIIAPALAVSLGACVIEKHFTLDRSSPGPDHPFSIEPDEFSQMVKYIRVTENMLGQSEFVRSQSESSMVYAKRSVIANKFIPAGKILDIDDITTKRPSNGIPASKYFDTINRKSNRDINRDEIITENDLESI